MKQPHISPFSTSPPFLSHTHTYTRQCMRTCTYIHTTHGILTNCKFCETGSVILTWLEGCEDVAGAICLVAGINFAIVLRGLVTEIEILKQTVHSIFYTNIKLHAYNRTLFLFLQHFSSPAFPNYKSSTWKFLFYKRVSNTDKLFLSVSTQGSAENSNASNFINKMYKITVQKQNVAAI